MLLVALFMLLSFPSAAQAWDTLYQCPDGTFTNRSELKCPRYTHASRLDDTASKRMAVTPLHTSRKSSLLTPSSSQGPDPASIQCTVYRQWLDLNRQTDGGKRFVTAADRRRWTTLSLMYRATGLPQCDTVQHVDAFKSANPP